MDESVIGNVALRAEVAPRVTTESLVASWVGETLLVADRAAWGNAEAMSLFWVRLYGVLTDVADFVALTADNDELHRQDGLCMFPLARDRADASPMPSALSGVRALFDEDELLYIEYRRHVECDPFQTRYRARRRGGVAQVPSVLLGGRPIMLDYAEAAFRRVLARHEFSDARVGRELARRSLPALRDLQRATD